MQWVSRNGNKLHANLKRIRLGSGGIGFLRRLIKRKNKVIERDKDFELQN
jgi:DNA-binding winged helix-turn-helix (wHTH) protein